MASTYCLQGESGGPVKFGRTTMGAVERIRSLQTGNPDRLRVVAEVEGDHEQEFHRRWARFRRDGGEWFNPNPRLLEWVESELDGAPIWPGETRPRRRRRSYAPTRRHGRSYEQFTRVVFWLAITLAVCWWTVSMTLQIRAM